MNRRRFMTMAGASLGAGPAVLAVRQGRAQTDAAGIAEQAGPVWEAWKTAYLRPDGRVVDRLQRNASHSEGQGYGLLLAAEFGDREAFDRILSWTEASLAIRPDALLAWRWLPDDPAAVPDLNNASDGDLFYAWALVRGSRRFAHRPHLDRAVQIAQALAGRCLLDSPANPGEVLFLPAVQGFVEGGRAVINPSYLMPLAMREVASATGVTELALAAQHGEALLLRLAQDGLVPDWVAVSRAGLAPADGFSPNAGYEAMRVPLFLIWSGLARHPAVTNMRQVYERTVLPGLPVPTRIEPVSGVVLETSPDAGYRALAGLVGCAGRAGASDAAIPPFDPSQPYYPATLQMFAMLAASQVVPECTPV